MKDDLRKQILALRYLEDITGKEIARRLGCTPSYVSQILTRAGAPMRRRWTEKEEHKLREAWPGDEPVYVIAQRLNRSVPAVIDRARELGLGLREYSDGPPPGSSPTWGMCPRERIDHLQACRIAPRENRDEEHWRLCLAEGGFPVSVNVDGRAVWVFPERTAA